MKQLFSLAFTAAAALAQIDNRVTLTVDVDNVVNYVSDISDFAKRGADPGPTPSPQQRAFTDFIVVGDIVAVNGAPAHGLWTSRGYYMNFSANPAPGSGIADVSRAVTQDCKWDFYDANNRFIGSIFDGGYAPHGVTGGVGAFYGVRGQMVGVAAPNPKPNRLASISEDPANRRTLGGGRGRIVFHLIPAERPQVQAVYHEDFTPVTAASPAKPGEVLILRASGLGPLAPGTFPSGTDPFPNPPADVNSPVSVTIAGADAPVLVKVGWPGQTDTYRVDVRVPAGITTTQAGVQITTAWISGEVFPAPFRP
jgi:hypothetical protein